MLLEVITLPHLLLLPCHGVKQDVALGPRVMPDIATGTKRTFIFLSSFAKMELSLGSYLCGI